MREKILNMLEKNSRIDLKDMAVMLGMTEWKSPMKSRYGKRACHLRL